MVTLSYPLSPFPPAFCRVDGSITKTAKAALTQYIEKITAEETDVIINGQSFTHVIYDGFYLLNKLVNVPELYGELSTKILEMITKNIKLDRVDLIFDTYPDGPSIKDYEHKLRHSVRENYTIRSGLQKRAQPFHKQLINITFKQKFVEFLINDWASDTKVSYLRDNNKNLTLFVNYDKCYQYKAVHSTRGSYDMVRTVFPELCSNHMEADTKVILHVCKTASITPNNILIRASDTDIFTIMLRNIHNIQNKNNTIFMQLGNGNSTRIVNVTKIHQQLGTSVAKAMPGLHSFTGCNFTPSFYRKGKTSSLKQIISVPEYQDAFMKLGDLDNLHSDDVFNVLDKFVCQLYGYKKMKKVDEVRHAMFKKSYNIETNTFFDKIKKFDACCLPPCQVELKQQFLRAACVTNIWQNAFISNTIPKDPLQYGWQQETDEDGQVSFTFKWFEGDQFPPNVQDVIIPEEDEEPEENHGKLCSIIKLYCNDASF